MRGKGKGSKKLKAFQLFDQGCIPSSPEVKELRLHPSTRYKYFYEWRDKGSPILSEPGTVAKGKAALPGGEAVAAISELELIKPQDETGEEQLANEGEPLAKEGEQKAKSDESKPLKALPGAIAGQGLPVNTTISVKTLALYQIAASIQEDELTLGDFIDACVEDTFRGRGQDLGLINLGGR